MIAPARVASASRSRRSVQVGYSGIGESPSESERFRNLTRRPAVPSGTRSADEDGDGAARNLEGTLKLGFLSCPVGLYTAVGEGDEIHFNMVNRRSGHRLRRLFVDPGPASRWSATSR